MPCNSDQAILMQRKISDKTHSINKSLIANKINHISFKNGSLLVACRHKKTRAAITISAKPLPCNGEKLECLWVDPVSVNAFLDEIEFEHILIPDAEKLYRIQSQLICLNRDGLGIHLPDKSLDVSLRSRHRYASVDIRGDLGIGDWVYEGELIDFTSVSFRIGLPKDTKQNHTVSNIYQNVHFTLKDHKDTYYTASCRIIKSFSDKFNFNIVLKPVKMNFAFLAPKKFRSERQVLIPTPIAIFKHPLTHESVRLEVVDISGVGFSLEEIEARGLLFPGLQIKDLRLKLFDTVVVCNTSQVTYCRTVKGKGQTRQVVRSGFVIKDIHPMEHIRLISLLNRAKDDNAACCEAVDLEDLWNFFFNSGFVYSKKFHIMQIEKEAIRDTVKKIYNDKSEISRHFLYQKKGEILGHISMLHFYANAWLVHHYAALAGGSIKAGLNVLGQSIRYFFESSRFDSSAMDFVICYYRPENRFPERFFGGAYRFIDDARFCSQDTFAYLYLNQITINDSESFLPYQLDPATADDIDLAKMSYRQNSNGLLFDALDIRYDSLADNALSERFRKERLERRRYFLSLKKDSELLAIFMLTISDPGLNFSGLTRCIHVLIINPDELSADKLQSVLLYLGNKFYSGRVPVLIFPFAWTEKHSLPIGRRYRLWIIHHQSSDLYLRYSKRVDRFF